MSDVKEINKYYPPDFDPEAFHRHKHLLKQNGRGGGRRKAVATSERPPEKKAHGRRMELRMLWPFSISCDNCSNVLFVGTKFNSKVEKIRTETYLGCAIWRISGICPDCRQDIVLKTDPKNTDYIVEKGGHRLFDAALAKREAEEAKQEYVEKQSQLNQMEQLEMKALNTAQEVEDLEILENLKRINRLFLSEHLNDDLLDLVKTKEGRADDDEAEIREFRRLKEEYLLRSDAEEEEESKTAHQDQSNRPVIILRKSEGNDRLVSERRDNGSLPNSSALQNLAGAYSAYSDDEDD